MMNYLTGLDGGLFHLTNAVWTNPLLDLLMPALSWAGNLGAMWIVLLGGLAVFGKKTGRGIALAGLVALAIGFASSEVIKEITMRPRPFAVIPDVSLLVGAPHSYAFPSGHTTSAFAAATGAVLAAKRLLGKVPAWGWGMLALAAAEGYSRLYVGVHWPSDVAAGAVLGLASGWAGTRLALRRWRKSADTSPAAPTATAGGREVEDREMIQR
ncbi:MAG: phosphatase PAP2 family protein [Rubrobacteraceae bacterium]